MGEEVRLKVAKIFYSVQGEGVNQGVPTTFIRLQGCNLLEPGCIWCFASGKVYYSGGVNRDISEVQPGDKLLAWNESNLVETTVEEVLVRNVDEYLSIAILGNELSSRVHYLRVTDEHPIMTSTGWKKAAELKVGDELFYLTSSCAQSRRMELHNPMLDPSTVERKVAHTDYVDVGRKVSAARLGWSDEEKKEIYERVISSRSKYPGPDYAYSMFEEVMIKRDITRAIKKDNNVKFKDLARERGLLQEPREFTEEHKKAISEAKLKNPTRLFGPDNPNWKGGISSSGNWTFPGEREVVYNFLIERDGKICQADGCTNTEELVVHHKFYDVLRDRDEELCLLCRICNSSVNHGRYPLRLKSGEIIPVPKVENGLPVVKINRVTRYSTAVYNLHCEPYNNFFVNNILCHNCDTRYARGDGGRLLSIEDILNEVVAAESRTYKHWVCITGGEPLFQLEGLHELVKALNKYGFLIEIETNGSIPKPFWWTLVDSWVADIKCPSSGVCGISSEQEWLDTRAQDQVKFVVGNGQDIDFARQMIMRNAARNPVVLISPVILPDGKAPAMKEAVNLSLRLKVRFSLQIHKYAEVE